MVEVVLGSYIKYFFALAVDMVNFTLTTLTVLEGQVLLFIINRYLCEVESL
jgi:hypothetical protein